MSQRVFFFGTLAGMLAGCASSLFGVGGGIVLVPLFISILGLEQKRAHATSLAAVIPIAIVGSVGYILNDHVSWDLSFFLALGGFVGVRFGARVLHHAPLRFVQILFSCVLLFTSLRLLWSPEPNQLVVGVLGFVILILVGLLSGALAGVLGIGGGIIVVPALLLLFGTDSLTARGTSLLVIVGTAWLGTRIHAARGFVDGPLALVAGVAGAVGAVIGVFLSFSANEAVVVRIFAGVLAWLAVKQFRMSRDVGKELPVS